MSYLEMLREQAEKFNADARKAAKELKRQNRRAAYKERERLRVAKYLREHPEKRKAYRKTFLERKGMTEYEYKHREYMKKLEDVK